MLVASISFDTAGANKLAQIDKSGVAGAVLDKKVVY